VNENEFKDELGRQGGDAEIESLDPKGRNPDDEARNGRHDTGQGRAIQKEKPSLVIRMAEVYPPTPANAACPRKSVR
jgi:hypothetical protein